MLYIATIPMTGLGESRTSGQVPSYVCYAQWLSYAHGSDTQPEAVADEDNSKDCFWPNSVGHDQQTSQLHPARMANPIGIRIQGQIRAWVQFFEIVSFIVLGTGALLRLLLTGDRVVGEAQTAAAVMVSGQRTLPGCPIVL